MSKTFKEKDKKYIEESYLSLFNEHDLNTHAGIKIKNSKTECYLKRKDDDNNDYWVKCQKINNRIIEIEKVSIETLLNRLNSDVRNYSLVMRG